MNHYENLDEMCQHYSLFFNIQTKMGDIGESNKYIDKEVEFAIDCIEEIINKIRIEEDKKPFLKIVNDYYIRYGDEGQLFDLHKPSDIRSLIKILNYDNGFSELQCEYNEE